MKILSILPPRRITARPTWPRAGGAAGGTKPFDRQRGRRPVAEHREAAGRVGIAAEPGEGAPADAGGIARFDDRVARGPDGEGIARQGEGEPLRVEAQICPRLDVGLGAVRPRIVDRGGDGDDAERQQADAQDDEHLQPGGKPRPARGEPVLQVAVQEGASVIAERRLTELPQQIEHFRRDVLMERSVVDRFQRVADGPGGTARTPRRLRSARPLLVFGQ